MVIFKGQQNEQGADAALRSGIEPVRQHTPPLFQECWKEALLFDAIASAEASRLYLPGLSHGVGYGLCGRIERTGAMRNAQ
jgi:hypothetical protein